MGKSIYVILEQEPPCNIKEMSSFLGIVSTLAYVAKMNMLAETPIWQIW